MKLLLVSSGGGHWVELLRLLPAFEGHDAAFVTVSPDYREAVPGRRFHVVRDATRWNKLGLLRTVWQLFRIVRRERPDVVLTTGAAPGYLAVRIARRMGARTVWIDSIANVEELSLSGKLAGRYADLWLTQWEHLASPGGPEFAGAVL